MIFQFEIKKLGVFLTIRNPPSGESKKSKEGWQLKGVRYCDFTAGNEFGKPKF